MNGFDALRPITRRELRVKYVSPLICPPVPYYSGSGSGSGDLSILPIEPIYRLPGPVISISKPNATSIRLDWAAVNGAYSYVVYRSTSSVGPFLLLTAGLLTNFYVDVPAIPGTYYYKVTAVEPTYGETQASAILSATV